MTTLQIVIAAGALVGLGVVLLVAYVLSPQPSLASTLERLTGERTRHITGHAPNPGGVLGRTGAVAARVTPAWVWSRMPVRDLAVMRMTPTQFLGQKVLFAGLGLVVGPAVGFGIMALQLTELPPGMPAWLGLVLAGVLFFGPDRDISAAARRARTDAGRTLSAYVDLVALERASGAMPRQAFEYAAQVGDSWLFVAIRSAMAESRLTGANAWDALADLGQSLAMPDLEDLADIGRLAGEKDARVVDQLRAKATSMRSSQLSDDLTEAARVSERMTLPMTLLGVIFTGLITAPALMRIVVEN